jgi:hypothetical protein
MEPQVAALPREARFPERHDVLALGHLAAERAVVELRLEHDDRIGIADRRGQQAFCVGGRRRDRDLHAGRVDVVGLGGVVVKLRRANPAAVRHAHGQRESELPSAPPAVAADVRDQLVETGVREGVVLHLADGLEPGHAEPDRAAEDPGLGERRVEAAVRTEAVAQTGRRAKDAAGAADILAQHHHVGIALELDVEAVVDCLENRELSQASTP